MSQLYLASSGGGGSGDVNGPASSTDNAFARFNGTTGKTLQNSPVICTDLGNVSGVGTLSADDAVLTNPLPAQYGGTGRNSHVAYSVICGGTTTTAAQQSVASVGTAGHVLTSNGAGALPSFQAAASGGLAWSEVTGTSQSMAVGNGYVANNAALITFTLPAVAAVGDVVEIVGVGAGGWTVAQNAGDIIHINSTDTTTGVGGSLASTNRYNTVRMVCVVASDEWVVSAGSGNYTIV